MLFLLIIILILSIVLIYDILKPNKKENIEEEQIYIKKEIKEEPIRTIQPIQNLIINEAIETKENYNLLKYEGKQYIMTPTEIKFYIELKKITDELNMSIFPQVDLERIIKVVDNNNRDRNRIKSRSIDYTIVNNNNYKIICCIELDDYTHNREKIKKADDFKNALFEKVNITLHRIKVNNNYNKEEIKRMLEYDLRKY